jgi:hypothetical protein
MFTLPAALIISSPAYMDYLGVIVTILATPEVGIAALLIDSTMLR